MRKNDYTKIVIIIILVLIALAGAYMLLRSPAPKPFVGEPEKIPQEQNISVEPIPGVPQFDKNKYTAEPTIKVWRAEKQSIEEMPLEKYLEGVVAQEMEPDWPIEALRSQAITARTITYHAIEAGNIRKLHNADVSTSKEELQAYAPEKVNDAIREAVKTSRGEVLLYAGSLINAIYSSNNGQIGATKEESMPSIPHPTPYFQPVVDSSNEFAPPKIVNWIVKIPGSEVASAIGYEGNAGDIKILEKGPSGRILLIGAGDKKINGADFRKRIGYDRLFSTLVTEMGYDGQDFTFKGTGWGNGLGLSQWGAYAFAQSGGKAEDILKHYYVGSEIIKLYE